MQLEAGSKGGRSLEAARPIDPPGKYTPLPERPRPQGVTLERVLRFLLGAGIAVVVIGLIWYFSRLLFYLLIGVVLAYLLKPVVDRAQGWGLGRIPAVLITLVTVFGTLAVLLTFLLPFATRQLTDLSQQIPLQQAAEITAVAPGSAADTVNIEQGEYITSIDGEPWRGFNQLQTLLRTKQPGDKVTLIIQDEEGAQRAVFISLGKRTRGAEDVQRASATEDAEERSIEPLGLTVREVTISEIATFLENRLRKVIPFMEHGTLIGAATRGFEALFREERVANVAGSLVGLFTNLFYAVIVIPFVMFFFLKDGTRIRHSLLHLVPNRYFEITLTIVEKIERNIGRYFRALLLQSASVAAVATVTLYVAGLQYAVAVGIFTGLANSIPYFGPLMGFLAGTLVGVAQTGDFSMTPGVLVCMALTQLADNLFFQPLIFARAAQAHPLVILIVVLISAQLGGIVGMLLAIPVMTVIRVTGEQILWSVRNYRIFRAS